MVRSAPTGDVSGCFVTFAAYAIVGAIALTAWLTLIWISVRMLQGMGLL